MIRGLHGLLYSSDAEASRAFLRDKLRLPFTDVGQGWLIFDLPEGDLGFHPTEEPEGRPGTHNLSFYCDDIQGTVAELRGRGVEFTGEPADHGYGWVTYFAIPGGIQVQLYEPKYRKRARPAAAPTVAAQAGAKAKPKAGTRAKAKAGTRAKPKTRAKAKPKTRARTRPKRAAR